MFVFIPVFVVSLGISGVAFAKHHQHQYKGADNKEDKGRNVPCLVNGAQLMVKSESVCKDFNGTVVPEKTSQEATVVSKPAVTVQKNTKPTDEKKGSVSPSPTSQSPVI